MPTSKNNPNNPNDETQKLPRLLLSEAKIEARLNELAAEINHDYADLTVVAICVLKGSFVFYSDLIRKLNLKLSCEFLGVSSYGSKMVTSGEVKLTLDLNEPIEGKHIILIEDIIDTGLTLNYILNSLKGRKPASIKVCSLLMKPECLKSQVEVDYVGFKIGNEFVVGYGIDYAGKYRGLPYIGVMEPEH